MQITYTGTWTKEVVYMATMFTRIYDVTDHAVEQEQGDTAPPMFTVEEGPGLLVITRRSIIIPLSTKSTIWFHNNKYPLHEYYL